MSGTPRMVLVVAIAAACGAPPDEPAAPPPLPAAERRLSVAADTLWTLTSAERDAVLIDPQAIAAAGGMVALLEASSVTFLDAAGQSPVRHEVPPASGAPGHSATMVPDAAGSVLVLREGAVTRLSRDGGAGAPAVLAQSWSLHTACALDGRGVVLTAGDTPIGVVATDGRPLGPLEYPWPALRDSALLLQQVLAASSPGTPGCVFAQSVGSGFATTADGLTFDTASYVERVPLPVIQTRVDSTADGVVRSQSVPRDIAYTAMRLAVSDRFIVVAFGGATPRRRGLVDVYDRGSRAYLGSAMLEVPIQGLAASGDTLYVMHDAQGTPQLAALRLRPPPAR